MRATGIEFMSKWFEFLHEIVELMVEFAGDIKIVENALDSYDLRTYFYDHYEITSKLDKPMLAYNIYQNYLGEHDVAFRKFESAVAWELLCRNDLLSKQETILMMKEYGLYDRYLKNPAAFKNLNIIVKMVADEVIDYNHKFWVDRYLAKWGIVEDGE